MIALWRTPPDVFRSHSSPKANHTHSEVQNGRPSLPVGGPEVSRTPGHPPDTQSGRRAPPGLILGDYLADRLAQAVTSENSPFQVIC